MKHYRSILLAAMTLTLVPLLTTSEVTAVELVLSCETSERNAVDLIEVNGHWRLALFSRELPAGVPQVAETVGFSTIFGWNSQKQSFQPIRLVDDDEHRPIPGLLFVDSRDHQPEVTTLRWDFATKEFGIVQVVAPKGDVIGPGSELREQSIAVLFFNGQQRVELAPKVVNLYYVSAQPIDIDNDGISELAIGLRYFRTQAVHVFKIHNEKLVKFECPFFESKATALEYLSENSSK